MKKISFFIFLIIIVFVFSFKLQSFNKLGELDNLELVISNVKPLLNNDDIIFYDSNTNSYSQLFKSKYAIAPFRLQELKPNIKEGKLVLIIDSVTIKQTTFDINLFELLYSIKEKGYNIKLIKKIK